MPAIKSFFLCSVSVDDDDALNTKYKLKKNENIIYYNKYKKLVKYKNHYNNKENKIKIKSLQI